MSLKIRWSESESILRSTGDPPNGIVGFVFLLGNEPTFAVDRSRDPAKCDGGLIFLKRKSEANDASPISIDETIDACAGEEERRRLYELVVSSVVQAAAVWAPRGRMDVVARAAAFGHNVAVRMASR